MLGAGGVGLLIGAALARAGRDVVILLREETLRAFGGAVEVESVVLGDFTVPVRAASRLGEHADVVWVATKAPALGSAIPVVPPARSALVVPLLNGVEHMPVLRRNFLDVVAASISVESERVAPGAVRQTSPFLRVTIAPGGELPESELQAAGVEVAAGASEAAVLWGKLSFLAPLALATTAADATFGAVRSDGAWRDRYERCRAEVCEVAAAEGAPQDVGRLEQLAAAAAFDMRSSLQKDVAAGRPSELDAIGGAVLRAAGRHGIAAPATEELVAAIRERQRIP